MKVIEVNELTDEIVRALQHLIPQLSPSTMPPMEDELAAVIDSPAAVLYVARDSAARGAIVGTLTLALYRTPTGVHAWIEDVVVDVRARGRGAGEALCRAALARAYEAGAASVDLTSRPARAAANRLYRRLGFEQRETNVYRYSFVSEGEHTDHEVR